MGPGEYTSDCTEGITHVEDLPQPAVQRRSRDYRRRRCPACGGLGYRYGWGQRRLHDLGDLGRNRPQDVRLRYSKHRCASCGHCFTPTMADLAPPGSHYTGRVIALAVRLVVEDGLPYRAASWHLWRDHRVFVPYATIQNWVETAGKKGGRAG
jgi:hypothetical protein